VVKPRLMDSPGGGRMSMVGNILTGFDSLWQLVIVLGWVSKLVDLIQRRKTIDLDDEDSEYDSMIRVINSTVLKLKK
jgi:hypothetical protein